MHPRRGQLGRLLRDDSGAALVEYTLLIGAFALPLIPLLALMLAALADHYKFITFLETLPFP